MQEEEENLEFDSKVECEEEELEKTLRKPNLGKPTLKDPIKNLPSLDLDGIVSYIKNGHAKNIIILQGAGISCAAGIPDFRSPGTGLYDNLKQYNLPYPERIFEVNFVRETPEPFFQVAKNQLPGLYKPTLAHHLPVLLEKHGLLTRVYTQNIDGLEKAAGLSSDLVVEAHGSFDTGTCFECRKKYQLKEFYDTISKGEVSRCPSCNGVIKPNVVLFGEDLPIKFQTYRKKDFKKCDLLIVIGSSLKVSPFCDSIALAHRNVPRLLLNKEIVATYDEVLRRTTDPCGNSVVYEKSKGKGLFKFGHKLNQRDVFYGGDCQETVKELIIKLGWERELQDIYNPDNI
ncbi:NAD-dependent protein deacetylase sirtuin-2 [Tritrichomonas foetus]|uniref:NAD-dependent protein deacetylase sirtuin-2 n=1 Tax=Tritrichomonas foetus TaxID=1144522 RepID=A0A1J4K6C9_9EUKA|nr:NAD-dependent protein deacetylase sirtuin-2 [Tritrichomonas foetus]|eukprot:OHT05260.1 NAD-dependent protein deacetylase sirtuin-2 [Tritrichomonas foetus]